MNRRVFRNIDKNLVSKFMRFHSRNPQVYKRFGQAARMMKRAGFQRYSAVTIINKIRWDMDLLTKGDHFKINNDFIALYARLFVAENPRYEGFFEIRRMKPYGRKQANEYRTA